MCLMTLLAFRPVSIRYWCAKRNVARYPSQRTARRTSVHPEADRGSFEASGIRPLVAASLRLAFPNVREPTAMQRKLIRAISQNRNVLLQDDTGTGKSFAAMLALLSKLPARNTSPVACGNENGTVHGLLLVPHRDLAYQYLHWIHYMTLSEGGMPSSLTKYAQVLVRHVNKGTLQGLPIRIQEAIKFASSEQDALIQSPPGILIATPNAILELMDRQPGLPWLGTLSTVVVDEVDALLGIPNDKVPKVRRRAPQIKHVPDLVRVLDRLYPTGKEKERRREDLRSLGHESTGWTVAHRPQLIMMSATLRHKLQSALFGTFGWVQRRDVLKLGRNRSSAVPAHRLCRSAVHHVLVVSKTGDIKNIDGARPLQPGVLENVGSLEEYATNDSVDGDGVKYEDEDEEGLVNEGDKELIHAPLAMDPAMLEAVAAITALEVPHVALLVLAATAPVRKIIFELRQLGVNAHALNLVENEALRQGSSEENPLLIVGTHATIRGIDIADLTHVFMIGVPEGRSGDVYLHVAGRVGRFGGRGKVITLVESERTARMGHRVVVTDEARRMRDLLSRLGVQATKLERFD